MKKHLFVLLLMGACVSATLQAQNTSQENTFGLSAQIRTRGEYRNGMISPRDEGKKPASFINSRARLSMGYQRDNLEIKFSTQHVGVWGQDPQIDKNGRFILHEAWAKLRLGNGFFTQLGRQGLVYDDDRILGSLDWNVAGRYHDALKFGYEDRNRKLHLILAFNQNDEKIIGGTYYAPGAQPYKNMQTLWYHYTGSQTPFNISLLFMNLGFETGDATEKKSDTKYLQTFGTYMTYAPSVWDLSGTFYYQSGKNKASQSVSGFMASITAGYKTNDSWKISLGSDYMSGENGKGDKYNAFDPLYGTHHKFYGTMDYFYASSFTSGHAPGLWDNYIDLHFKPSPEINMGLTGHYFNTAAKLEDLNRSLGTELDYQLNWKIMKDATLTFGYSVMFGTKTMDAVKGGNHKSWQDWGWISLNLTPKLFSAKW